MMEREEHLARLWTDLDQCAGCRDSRFADLVAPAPARPFRPPRPRPLLFLGEAPPKTGGFWRPRNGDAVRRLLLPALPSWPELLDWDSREAIDWFIDAGFFFVQAMKWTLAHQSYVRLTTRQKCLAVDHAVQAHLLREIELSQPRAIIALGTGAWDSCLLLPERYGQPPLAESRVAAARLRHHDLRRSKEEEIPLHVTFLPGRINESVPDRIAAIGDDVGVFVRCIEAGSGCEAAERRAVTPRTIGRAAGEADEFRDWRRRLRAVGLWPRPPGLTMEQVAQELERREAIHRHQTQDGCAR